MSYMCLFPANKRKPNLKEMEARWLIGKCIGALFTELCGVVSSGKRLHFTFIRSLTSIIQ